MALKQSWNIGYRLFLRQILCQFLMYEYQIGTPGVYTVDTSIILPFKVCSRGAGV